MKTSWSFRHTLFTSSLTVAVCLTLALTARAVDSTAPANHLAGAAQLPPAEESSDLTQNRPRVLVWERSADPADVLAGEPAGPPADAPVEKAEPTGPTPSMFLTGDWAGARTALSRRGLDFEFRYAGEVLSNLRGGLKPGTIYEGLFRPRVNFDLGKFSDSKLGKFRVSAVFPHGRSLSENYTGDLFVLSNIDAPDIPRLFELWYEQSWGDDRFSLRLGKLTADDEFATTETGGLFLNGTCGWPAFLGANTPSPAYPTAALGARLAIKLSDRITIQSGLYDGHPDPDDAMGRQRDPNGVGLHLSEGALWLNELILSRPSVDGDSTLPGTFRLGGWWHSDRFAHQRLDADGLSLADPASTGAPRMLRNNWGLFLAAEQQVYREPSEDPRSSQGLGVYTRLGGSPPDRNLLEFYSEAGLNYRGLIPGRDEDESGVAVVYGKISREAGQLTTENNRFTGGNEPRPDFEVVMEATYRVWLRPGCRIRPSVQWILHPGGSKALGDALVIGLRVSLDL